MFENIKSAIAFYLMQNPYMQRILNEHPGSTVEPAALPPEYNSTPYCTIVDGHMVNTVGEYKEALAKFTESHGG